jgi:hypothetical protein
VTNSNTSWRLHTHEYRYVVRGTREELTRQTFFAARTVLEIDE